MTAWDASRTIADSKTFNADETASASLKDFHTPAICVQLENLDGEADDTITVDVVGDVGTYEVDSRTLSSTGSYVVTAPQADTVKVTSANGTTISAEARNNPR